MKKTLCILGIRGIPAAHGGFETFAEQLALYLVPREWDVTVYCQEEGAGQISEDTWCGIRRVKVPVTKSGAAGTVIFDWKAIDHLVSNKIGNELVLTLGYNTALFCVRLRMAGLRNIINMDGIEWKRDKWRWYERTWLWINERAGCLIGDHLVADHPSIADHLATRVSRSKITTIPYGAHDVHDADIERLKEFNLEPGRYITVIARPEPENSILDIVRAFSRRPRGCNLVLLGNYEPKISAFHRAVVESASSEVKFLGAIYDRSVVNALRVYSKLYVHGHRVGGTNPSLVEALGCQSAVLAHNNRFNRWVAGNEAFYFSDEASCANAFDELLVNDAKIESMKTASRNRFLEAFTWPQVLLQYERLFLNWRATE